MTVRSVWYRFNAIMIINRLRLFDLCLSRAKGSIKTITVKYLPP